jgi:hypothetical protein
VRIQAVMTLLEGMSIPVIDTDGRTISTIESSRSPVVPGLLEDEGIVREEPAPLSEQETMLQSRGAHLSIVLNHPMVLVITTEHAQRAPAERDVFERFSSLHSLMAETDPGLPGVDAGHLQQRREALQSVAQALHAATARRDALLRLGAGDAVDALAASMVAHIPPAWLQDGVNLEARIDSMCRPMSEQRAMLEEALAVCEDVQDVERSTASGYGANASAADRRALSEVLLQRAQRIIDMGGSVDDIERTIAHIPTASLPLEFVQRLLMLQPRSADIAVGERTLAAVGDRILLGDEPIITSVPDAAHTLSLLEGARSGNPVPIIRLLQDSQVHARALLGELVRSGDTLAEALLCSGGLRDSHLSNPAFAEAVLRQVLGEQAGDVSVLAAYADEDASAAMMPEVTDPERLLEALTRPYSNTPIPSTELTNPAQWFSDFRAAMFWAKTKAGLYKLTPQVNRTIKALIKPLLSWELLLKTYITKKSTLPITDPEMLSLKAELSTGLLTVQSLMADADSVLCGYRPVSASGAPHRPMLQVCVRMSYRLEMKRQELQQDLRHALGEDAYWSPACATSLSSEDWVLNWESAARFCRVTSSDQGMQVLLSQIEQHKDSSTMQASNNFVRRGAQLKYINYLREALNTIHGLAPQTSKWPNLNGWLRKIIEMLQEQIATYETLLTSHQWLTNPISSARQLDPRHGDAHQNWQNFMSAAHLEGFISGNQRGLGVGKALKTLRVLYEDLSTEPDPSVKQGIRKEIKLQLLIWLRGLDSVDNMHLSRHPAFVGVLMKSRSLVAEFTSAINTEQATLSFQSVSGLTPQAWLQTYSSALEAGVIEASSDYDALYLNMSSLEALKEQFVSADDNARLKFELVLKILSVLNSIRSLIESIISGGRVNNKRMLSYLKGLDSLCDEHTNDRELSGVLYGTGKDFPSFSLEWPSSEGEYHEFYTLWEDIQQKAEKVGIYSRADAAGLDTLLQSVQGLISRYVRAQEEADDLRPQHKRACTTIASLAKEIPQTQRNLDALEGSAQAISETIDALMDTITRMGDVDEHDDKHQAWLGLNQQHQAKMAHLDALRVQIHEASEKISRSKTAFVDAQGDLQEWATCQRVLSAARRAYSEQLDQIILGAQKHLKRTQCVNFQGVFTELINGSRMQKRTLREAEAYTNRS